jgi:multicomponent Na+:H+ antiporter subunit E
MGGAGDRNWLKGSLFRAAGFWAFWVVLAGYRPSDLATGVLAAVAATWASLRLLPPAQTQFRPVALAAFILRFIQQSVGAGIDVAWRALDPRLPLAPGFVVYRPQLPPGPMRDAFSTVTSLLPGTLPCGSDQRGGLVIHCLDVNQPVLEQLAREEALFVHALGGPHEND